jgi:hypothetical protein
MDQIFKNLTVGFAFLAITLVWLGFPLWMRVEADKRNMLGWAWTFAGILLPVVSWIVFIALRKRHPIVAEVFERDEILDEAKRQNQPFILQKPPPKQPSVTPAEKLSPEKELSPEESIQAALEAEQRRYQN